MLVGLDNQPLNPKLRAEAAKKVAGWVICKIAGDGLYQPVVDGRAKMLAIAPTLEDAGHLAESLCQRELQPRPGALVQPGQESSTYMIFKLTVEGIVNVKIDDAQKLLNGGKSA